MNVSRISLARRAGVLAVGAMIAAIATATAAASHAPRPHSLYAHAQGGARPDDRAGTRGIGSVSTPAQHTRNVVDDRRPDDRAGVRGIGSSASASASGLAARSGFDWADAGIGAGITLGLMLLGTGAVFVGVRHRRSAGLQSSPTTVLEG